MAIQENGITFTNVSRVGIGSPFNNVVNGDIQNESDLKDYIDAGEEYRNIQSVLIDWNSAQVCGRTINTTGDFLVLLSYLAKRADELEEEYNNKLNSKYPIDFTVEPTNCELFTNDTNNSIQLIVTPIYK